MQTYKGKIPSQPQFSIADIPCSSNESFSRAKYIEENFPNSLNDLIQQISSSEIDRDISSYSDVLEYFLDFPDQLQNSFCHFIFETALDSSKILTIALLIDIPFTIDLNVWSFFLDSLFISNDDKFIVMLDILENHLPSVDLAYHYWDIAFTFIDKNFQKANIHFYLKILSIYTSDDINPCFLNLLLSKKFIYIISADILRLQDFNTHVLIRLFALGTLYEISIPRFMQNLDQHQIFL